MKKVVVTTTKVFDKKISKLTNKNIYNFIKFDKDVELFLQNETNPKFRKHKLNWYNEDVYSISLWYDLRALYFFIRQKENWEIEYLFFDIWDHDEIY